MSIVTVVFDMWGQRCETKFDATSELDPIVWIETCFSKGFVYPVEVILENGAVLYDEEQLNKMMAEML